MCAIVLPVHCSAKLKLVQVVIIVHNLIYTRVEILRIVLFETCVAQCRGIFPVTILMCLSV